MAIKLKNDIDFILEYCIKNDIAKMQVFSVGMDIIKSQKSVKMGKL